MKKFLMIALAGLLVSPLAACGMDKNGGETKLNKTKASSTVAKAGKNVKTVATAKAKDSKS